DIARDRTNSHTAAPSSVPRLAALPDRSHRFCQNALRHGSPGTVVGTGGRVTRAPARLNDKIPPGVPGVHQQDCRTTIPGRPARLWRADGADWRYANLDPAVDLGRGQWKLAPGSVASIR